MNEVISSGTLCSGNATGSAWWASIMICTISFFTGPASACRLAIILALMTSYNSINKPASRRKRRWDCIIKVRLFSTPSALITVLPQPFSHSDLRDVWKTLQHYCINGFKPSRYVAEKMSLTGASI